MLWPSPPAHRNHYCCSCHWTSSGEARDEVKRAVCVVAMCSGWWRLFFCVKREEEEGGAGWSSSKKVRRYEIVSLLTYHSLKT